ncbi:hypothetical protein K8R42_03215, partial [bacterium]|nr:hypothetical protein [bacterium]
LEDNSGKRYLIDGLEKRLINSDEAFRQLGFNPDEVETATSVELENYQTGDVLTEDSSPFEEIWQDSSTQSIYYVKDGQKAKIIDSEILELNYPEMEIREVTSKTLEGLTGTTPLKFVDGALIKKEFDKNVYVVSNGYRRLIPDGDTFNKLGYNWANIRVVSNKVMNFHIIGESIPSQ